MLFFWSANSWQKACIVNTGRFSLILEVAAYICFTVQLLQENLSSCTKKVYHSCSLFLRACAWDPYLLKKTTTQKFREAFLIFSEALFLEQFRSAAFVLVCIYFEVIECHER